MATISDTALAVLQVTMGLSKLQESPAGQYPGGWSPEPCASLTPLAISCLPDGGCVLDRASTEAAGP